MTQRMKNRYLSLVLLSFIAMASFGLGGQGADPRADGIWRAHGYGLILEVHSGKAKLYEVTRISCVPASDEDSSDFDLEKFKEVRLSSAGDLLTLYHRNGNVYRYSREPSRPAACENYQATDDPEHNFEIFWNTFEENYAFFHIHNVDWHVAYKVYRPRITPETSPEELLEIFGEMVAPLRDYHVSIRTKKKRISHSGYRLRDKVDEVWELVRSKYLKGNYNTRLNQLSFGKLDEKTGYLRIRRMAGFTLHHPTTREETLRLLEQAMDEVLESFQGVEKVILDVRFNGGGSDPPARYFAERFTDRRRLAYSKQARHGDYNEFTPMVEFYIEPKGKSQFTGKVVVLINGASGSATEIFAECVQALPHVTIVGENTEGAFSDNLMRTLPNGWVLSLSNEAYYNHEGVCLEGLGVPPHIEVPLTLEDLEEGRDRALEKAMSL